MFVHWGQLTTLLVNALTEYVGHLDVVFIDAIDESLARRFNETRRLHPLSRVLTTHLSDALKRKVAS